MKGTGRALLIAVLLLFGYVCTSTAQDAVSLAGLAASLQGNSALVELHTTGPAEFQVDRFAMGNWVTVWSRSFQSSGVKEIPLEFNHPELSDLVASMSLVTENDRPGIRIYLGPEANRTGVFTMRDGDITQVVIPARENAALTHTGAANPSAAITSVPATHVAGPAGAPGDSMEGKVELIQPNAAAMADAARQDQIATQREAAPEVETDDTTTSAGAAFFVPRQELPEGGDSGNSELAHAQPLEAETTEGSSIEASTATRSGVAPGKFRSDDKVKFIPQAKKTKIHSAPAAPVAASSPTAAEQPEVMLPARITENLPAGAQIHYQYPADDSQSDEKSGTSLEDITLQDLMDQAMQNAGQMMGLPGFEKQAPQAQTQAAPGAISTPTVPAYSSFQAAAEVSTSLGAAADLGSGKDALSGIMIDLFEILGTPLDQALTLLIAPTDYNVIVDAEVGKNIVSLSFKESRTDLRTALNLLTRTYGLEYVVDSNTIVIAAKDKINGHLVDYTTRIFVLSFADPKSVKDMLVKTGQLREDQIEIYQGEQAYAVVNDSTKLSEVSSGTESGGAAGGSNSQIKPIESNLSSSPRNALLVKAVPSQMDIVAALIAEIDRKPRLIELEVRVCEAQDKALKNLGIAINGNETDTPISTDTGSIEQVNGQGVIEAFTLGSFNRTANPLEFLVSLNTQIQERTVDVLAQPTLSTVEGKQAIYFAGETVPYISKVTQNNQGTQVEVDFLKLGVTLNFKPRLDADGKLTIDVNPIVSSLLEFRKIGDLMEAPRTSERQVATTVRVADCEPFVLAGLINEEERKTVTKIPMLGDLPLVGKLFRNTNNNGQRTEIIIVVVPHIHE